MTKNSVKVSSQRMLFDRRVDQIVYEAKQTVMQDTHNELALLMEEVCPTEQQQFILTIESLREKAYNFNGRKSLLSAKKVFGQFVEHANTIANITTIKLQSFWSNQLVPSLSSLKMF